MYQTEDDKKKSIIEILSKVEYMVTGEIQAHLGSNYWIVKRLLTDLEKEGIVESIHKGYALYWRIKPDKNKSVIAT